MDANDLERLERSVSEGLDRHQGRRDQGVPAPTVLLGPVEGALERWHRWAQAGERALAVSRAGDLGTVAAQWSSALVPEIPLGDAALARLAGGDWNGVAPWRERVRSLGRDQRELNQSPLMAAGLGEAGRRLLDWLIERVARGEESAARDPHEVSRVVGEAPGLEGVAPGASRYTAVLVAMAEILPPARRPALLWVPQDVPEANDAPPDRNALAGLARLAVAAPGLPLAVALTQQRFAQWLDAMPESHPKAVLRDGVIRVPRLPAAALADWACARYGATRVRSLAPALEVLTRSGSSLVRLDALLGPLAASTPLDDAARSEAERFLFLALEQAPRTAGRFVLNGTLEHRFGARAMEVDLLCRSGRLAVEIDGYHHFQDPDRYRRDRRKDFDLQRHGYWVLRYLADDVVVRLEDILSDIEGALAMRPEPITPQER